MPSDPSDVARGRTRRTVPHPGGLANSHRLAALGAAIDEKAGIKHKNKVPKAARTGWRRHQGWWVSGVSVLLVIAVIFGGGYLYVNWRFGQIPKITNTSEVPVVPNKPFNILEIGSDSRVGLSGFVAAQTGATTGAVSGQRSDVIKIMHVDPVKGTITVLSIPRDTVVTLLANQNLYGNFNRLNVNFQKGASLLTKTITANFGIPIAHTIVVGFAGIINVADAIGGVYLNFPYPAKDLKSSLNIPHAGCQLVTNFQALALVRSRYYQWYEPPYGWREDVTSDFGRIYRQNEFIKAMMSRAKGMYNPLTLNSLLSQLPQGIALDSNFSLGELIGLVRKFHNIDPASLQTITLPVGNGGGVTSGYQVVQEPAAEQTLVNIFGTELLRPTNPPPNINGVVVAPPVIAVTTTTVKAKTASVVIPTSGTKFLVNVAASTAPTTTTSVPEGQQFFDPTPCTPK